MVEYVVYIYVANSRNGDGLPGHIEGQELYDGVILIDFIIGWWVRVYSDRCICLAGIMAFNIGISALKWWRLVENNLYSEIIEYES